MKDKFLNKERGQALVIIALAAIALFGFAALAIDGSRVFSDRRHAQNAADTSALDAALVVVRQGSGGPWESEGLARAASNGYDDNGTSNDVNVYYPPIDGIYAGDDEYIQVKIRSNVDTFFARVIGINQVTNRVEAVTRVTVPVITPWFDGQALISTMMGCKGENGDNNNPFTVAGSSSTVVHSSGIFVNSDCEPAFYDNGGANGVTTDEGICVVGGTTSTSGIVPPPTGHCRSQIDPSIYKLPNMDCATPGSIEDKGGGVYEAWPGYFDKTGNKTFPDASPAGKLYMHKGIYCLYNGISVNAGWEVTSDLNDNDVRDPDEGILLYVPDGDITFNGGAFLDIHAINSTIDDFPETLLNYLIYIPPTNEADVKISGSSGSQFTGTILAPTSHINLEGSGETFSLNAQVIGYDTVITGSGDIEITYNQADNAVTTTQPGIEVAQ
jgi:hypothetical protein